MRTPSSRRLVAFVSVVLLGSALVAGCGHGHSRKSPSKTPPSAWGPAIGAAPSVTLPNNNPSLRIAPDGQRTTSASDLLWGQDRQLGSAYQVSIDAEPAFATVTFVVDPGQLAAATGVRAATTAGLYIQVYETQLGSWIPLRSTYNPGNRTVSATTPHLSIFSLSWSDVECAVTCPSEFMAKVGGKLWRGVVHNLNDAWSPTHPADDCRSKADPGWAVTSTISKLTGCLIDSSSDATVQIQNPLLLPLSIDQPDASPHSSLTSQPFIQAKASNLSTIVSGLLDWATGSTVIPPRWHAVLPLTSPLVSPLRMATRPDDDGIVIDVMLSLLIAIPEGKTDEEVLEEAVRSAIPELVAKSASDPGSLTADGILKTIQDAVDAQKAVLPGPATTFLTLFSNAYGCASETITSVTEKEKDEGLTDQVFDGLVTLAMNCTETALKLLGQELNHSLQDVLDVIDAVPDFLRTVREGVQFVEIGPSGVFADTEASKQIPVTGSLQFSYKKIAVSGFDNVRVGGINDAGEYCGASSTASPGHAQVFIGHNGKTDLTFTPSVFSIPPSDVTSVSCNGIDRDGDVVGDLLGSVNGKIASASFERLANGQLNEIRYPNSTATGVNGLSEDGALSGYCVDTSGYLFGFIQKGSGLDPWDVASFTKVSSDTGTQLTYYRDTDGTFLGYYEASGKMRGFSVLDGQQSSIPAGPTSVAFPVGITDAGVVYGVIAKDGGDITGTTATAKVEAVAVKAGAVLARFTYPGASVTEVDAMNGEGVAVGQYSNSTSRGVFMATPK